MINGHVTIYHYNDTRSTVMRWSFDNDKRHVMIFRPIREARHSWSYDKFQCPLTIMHHLYNDDTIPLTCLVWRSAGHGTYRLRNPTGMEFIYVATPWSCFKIQVQAVFKKTFINVPVGLTSRPTHGHLWNHLRPAQWAAYRSNKAVTDCRLCTQFAIWWHRI